MLNTASRGGASVGQWAHSLPGGPRYPGEPATRTALSRRSRPGDEPAGPVSHSLLHRMGLDVTGASELAPQPDTGRNYRGCRPGLWPAATIHLDPRSLPRGASRPAVSQRDSPWASLSHIAESESRMGYTSRSARQGSLLIGGLTEKPAHEPATPACEREPHVGAGAECESQPFREPTAGGPGVGHHLKRLPGRWGDGAKMLGQQGGEPLGPVASINEQHGSRPSAVRER